MLRAVFVFAAMLAFASVASAQGTSGTPEDQAACRASVQRYCAQVLACSQQNRARISKPCQQVLIKYGQ